MGFFGANQFLTGPPKYRLPQCGSCGLLKKCNSPKMPVRGDGERGILLVGEWPSASEDEDGEVFSGSSYSMVMADLKRIGIKADRDCWMTYALICNPGKEASENQLGYCLPNLKRIIQELKPKVIVLFGTPPVTSLIGDLWKDKPGGIDRWAGYQIPSQELNAWICPIYSPRQVRQQEEKQPVARLWFRKILEAAVGLQDVPWPDGPPKYDKTIELIYGPAEAAKAIREIISRGKPAAFDYESDRLKPDHPEATILTASICSGGDRTISYLWTSETADATREFLTSPLPKIFGNAKHEIRWTRAKLNCEIRNIVHDVVLHAKWVDNRRGVTSVKFQSFALLGYPGYSEVSQSLIRGDGGNGANRLKSMNVSQLLKYNARDSVLTYHIAKKQMEMAKS